MLRERWCWWFTLIFSITLLLYSSQVNTDTALPHSEWDFSKLHGTILSTICVVCVLPRPWTFFVLWFFFFCYKHQCLFEVLTILRFFLVIQKKNYVVLVSVMILWTIRIFLLWPIFFIFCVLPRPWNFFVLWFFFFATLTNAFLKL